MPWVREYGGGLPQQVYPTDDDRPHLTTGTSCWCDPHVEGEGESAIVVHNSADGREKYERGERKPN
jgi:hypothetical protein